MDEKNNTQVGFTNDGDIVVKDRAWRRRRKNSAELDGLSKKFYTTKRIKTRKRNGKTTKIRKKSSK